jgi:hypothetical protein
LNPNTNHLAIGEVMSNREQQTHQSGFPDGAANKMSVAPLTKPDPLPMRRGTERARPSDHLFQRRLF